MTKEIRFDHTDEPVCKCRACGREIFFKKLPSGKLMPVAYEGPGVAGLPHFADCPNASDFRNRKTGPKQGREVRFKK